MSRYLHISSDNIKSIKNKLIEDVEYGGWFEFDGNGNFIDMISIKGNELNVSIPSGNYEIHWHTHPSILISNYTLDQTGPFQSPSVHDISTSSYSYFDYNYGMGSILLRLVFTKYGIYVQEPMNNVLDKILGNNFVIFDEDTKNEWIEKWYKPFKKKADKIRNKINSISFDLGGYIDEDTEEPMQHYNKEEWSKNYKEAIELENEYFHFLKNGEYLLQNYLIGITY